MLAGCLRFIGLVILGIFYLIFLVRSPGLAIFLGIPAVIGYIFWSKQQKIRAAEKRRQELEQQRQQAIILAEQQQKRLEEQRQQAIILAEQQQKQLEEQRQQAVLLARQRENLYAYDPSIQALDKRSTKNIVESPDKWAEAIEGRYEAARKHLGDVELVLNDDIDLFNQYRNQLQTELIPKYEAAIRPFFDELSLRDNEIPTPRELKAAVDFVYPMDLQPNEINKEISKYFQTYGNSIRKILQDKNLAHLQQRDITSLAFVAVIAITTYLFTISKQREKLEQVQADLDLICEQISGAIKTYGRASDEIKHLKLVHEVRVNYLMLYLDTVSQLTSTGKTFDDLQESERKAVEICYRGGQSLKEIITQDIIKPITSTN